MVQSKPSRNLTVKENCPNSGNVGEEVRAAFHQNRHVYQVRDPFGNRTVRQPLRVRLEITVLAKNENKKLHCNKCGFQLEVVRYKVFCEDLHTMTFQ